MKTKLSFLLVSIALLIGCQVSEPVFLTLTETSFDKVSASGNTLTVKVKSNDSWVVSSNNPEWCKPDKSSGSNNEDLNITISKNTTLYQRAATITIETNNIKQKVIITQSGGSLPSGELGNYHYQIPVIFHALYKDQNDSQQYINKGRVKELIDACNAYYKGLSGTNSEDINIEFVLATLDPSGNVLEEPGIERINWTESEIDCEAFMKSKEDKYIDLIWDPDRYVNIMLYSFKQKADATGTTLGISHLPYTVAPLKLGGLNQLSYMPTAKNLSYPHCVSINNKFIYSKATVEGRSYSPTDVIATLSHELGHYLGLHHIFSEPEVGDGCEDTDFCEDTPTYDRDAYENWLSNEYRPQNGVKITFDDLPFLMKRRDCLRNTQSTPNNVMDYSYSYANRFTPEQNARIRFVLQHSPFVPGPKAPNTTSRTVPNRQEFPIQVKI